MSDTVDRPIILPLSNPVSKAEAHPTDVLRWSSGRAIIGTGSPYPIAAECDGEATAQVNNAYICPGVGLGALASGARSITDGMFMTAARALAERSRSVAQLLPPIEELRDVALCVASAVASQAVLDGVATIESVD